MQVNNRKLNGQKSRVDETDTSNNVKARSKSTGLVKGVLNSVLSGNESAVFVPKADNASEDQNENEKIHDHHSESAAATRD